MRYLIALLSVVFLVFTFRKVRERRIILITEQKRKKEAFVAAITETASWRKLHIPDVRPERGRHIYDAPSYTSHTEATGKFKRPQL